QQIAILVVQRHRNWAAEGIIVGLCPTTEGIALPDHVTCAIIISQRAYIHIRQGVYPFARYIVQRHSGWTTEFIILGACHALGCIAKSVGVQIEAADKVSVTATVRPRAS